MWLGMGYSGFLTSRRSAVRSQRMGLPTSQFTSLVTSKRCCSSIRGPNPGNFRCLGLAKRARVRLGSVSTTEQKQVDHLHENGGHNGEQPRQDGPTGHSRAGENNTDQADQQNEPPEKFH